MPTTLANVDTVQVQQEGTLVGIRPIINFSGSGVVVADDGANDRVDITIEAGLANAYAVFKNADGSQVASAVGAGEFKFVSNNTISINVVDNDPIYGDHIFMNVVDDTSIQKSEYVVGFNSSTRRRIDFIEGTGIGLTLVDDSDNNKAKLEIFQVPKSVNQLIQVLNNNVNVGIQPALNFIMGSNLALNAFDNAPLQKIDLTFSLTGGTTNRVVVWTSSSSLGSSRITDSLSGNIVMGAGVQYNNVTPVTPPANSIVLYTKVISGTPKRVQLVARFENGNEQIIVEEVI